MAAKRKTKTSKQKEAMGPSKWRLQHGSFDEAVRSADPETGTPVQHRYAMDTLAVMLGKSRCDNPATSMLVFLRREQDELHSLRTLDITIMSRRDLEEITRADTRLDSGFEHANDEPTADTIAGMAHRAGCRRAEEWLLVGLPCPTRLEDRVHSGGTVGHPDDGDSAVIFHVQQLVRRLKAPDFDL